jgi:hypothetical protein
MDESIIERGKDMGDAKDEFSLTDLRTKTHNFFLLHNLLLRRLHSELAFSHKKRTRGLQGSTMMEDVN